MQKSLLTSVALLYCFISLAQDLPRGFASGEQEKMSEYLQTRRVNTTNYRGILTPPSFQNIRNAAEWEEIQSLTTQ